jgi:hypothetical protein
MAPEQPVQQSRDLARDKQQTTALHTSTPAIELLAAIATAMGNGISITTRALTSA